MQSGDRFGLNEAPIAEATGNEEGRNGPRMRCKPTRGAEGTPNGQSGFNAAS